MWARCPDHGTILQVSPLHNEKRVLLNCLDGGQDGPARCQVLPAGNRTGGRTKTRILPLLKQTFGGQQDSQGAVGPQLKAS